MFIVIRTHLTTRCTGTAWTLPSLLSDLPRMWYGPAPTEFAWAYVIRAIDANLLLVRGACMVSFACIISLGAAR